MVSVRVELIYLRQEKDTLRTGEESEKLWNVLSVQRTRSMGIWELICVWECVLVADGVGKDGNIQTPFFHLLRSQAVDSC